MSQTVQVNLNVLRAKAKDYVDATLKSKVLSLEARVKTVNEREEKRGVSKEITKTMKNLNSKNWKNLRSLYQKKRDLDKAIRDKTKDERKTIRVMNAVAKNNFIDIVEFLVASGDIDAGLVAKANLKRPKMPK